MSKQTLIILIVFLATFGAITALVITNNNTAVEAGTLSLPVSDRDHIEGNPNGKIVMVEYSDFQCPACGAYYPIVKKLVADFSELKVVYRNFPLKQIHKNAETAARAAEAAALQGKFWEMHDLMFEKQTDWSASSEVSKILEQYAVSLGMNLEKFKSDINSDAVKNKVKDDYDSGYQSGVQGTPTFFINGKAIQNPNGYEPFKALIENALKAN